MQWLINGAGLLTSGPRHDRPSARPALPLVPCPRPSEHALPLRAGAGGSAEGDAGMKTLNIIGYPSPGFVRAADWLFP